MLTILGLSTINYTAKAQCTPNTGCTTDVCPDAGAGLPDGTVGVFYSEVITVVIPIDSAGFTVDSVELIGVGTLPPGLSYTCTPPSCTWPGNSFGCFVISGTPTDSGTYNLTLFFSYYLNGLPPQPGQIIYNSITVNGGSPPVCTPNTGCTTDLCPATGAGLPDGTEGVPYSESITVVIPQDSSGFTVDSVELLSISGLPPGLTYTCEPPSCTWPGNSFGCFVISGTPTTAGTYTLTLNFMYYLDIAGPTPGTVLYNTITINGVGGCNVQSSFTSSPGIVCQGDTVSFTNTSTGATSYNWLENGNSFATTANTTRVFGTAGTYIISLVADSATCSDTSSVIITVLAPPANPTITASGPTTFCQGDSVVLTGASGPALIWYWSTGQGTTSIVVTTSGSYTYTAEDINGCKSTSAPMVVTVTSGTIPTITASGPTSFCPGDSVTLTSSTGSTYFWSTGATTQSITVSIGGAYTVTVADSTGCSGTSTPTIVTLSSGSAPTITASGPTSICPGDSVILTSSTGNTYLWSTGATTQSITVSVSGAYTVTVPDSTGCIGTSTPTIVTVSSGSAPTITASGPTAFCQGDDVILVTDPGSSYLWSSGETTQSITVSASGVFTVTVTDSVGCSGTSLPTTVTVSPSPTIDLVTSTDASSCGASDGTINISASGGTAPLQYSIDGGATFVATNGFSGLSTGNYDVVVTDVLGCTVVGNTETITAPGAPTATAGANATICAGSDYTLSGTMGGTASSITWTSSGSGTFDTPSSVTATYTPSPGDISNGSVILTITSDDPDGIGPCTPAVDNMTLTINSGIVPSITLGGTTLSSSFASTYQWFFNGDTIAGATGQFYVATQTGFYTVTVTDINGCMATSAPTSVTVGIGEYISELDVLIYPNPNTGLFTLELNTLNSQSLELRIFNMVGQIVYNKSFSDYSGIFTTALDLTAQPPGIYNIQLATDKQVIVRRVVVE